MQLPTSAGRVGFHLLTRSSRAGNVQRQCCSRADTSIGRVRRPFRRVEAMRSSVPRVRSTMKALEVHNLRKEFLRRDAERTKLVRRRRRVPALHGVSFEIERGECVAILGQNGSGKSTLVRLLSTLLLNDGGSAHVFGHDVFTEQRAVQRLVNRVSVEASFFKKMSSEENLAYAARFYGITPRVTKTAIPEILDRVGFPVGRRHEAMENLSRGMQQKVALARALLT